MLEFHSVLISKKAAAQWLLCGISYRSGARKTHKDTDNFHGMNP
jgi:hypothetical protein